MSDEPGTEIERAPISAPAVVGPVGRDEWMSLVEQATRIAHTKIVPEVFRGKPDELIAVTLLSREVGRGLMWGLRYVYISRDGRTAMHAEGMLGLMAAAGIEIWPIETTTKIARIGWQRGARSGEISYTLDEAVAAGLCTLDANGNAHARSRNDNPLPWETYTGDLLWARVVSRTARRVAPDVIGGMSYVPEEIGARVDPETGEVHAGEVETISVEKAREIRARISDLSPAMKKGLRERFYEMGAVIASGKDTPESPIVPMLPASWLERVEEEIAGVEQWEPAKAAADDEDVVEGEVVGGEPEGPIPNDDPPGPPIQIVTNNPARAGHVVRSVPVDSTGVTDVSAAIEEIIDSVPSGDPEGSTLNEWGWHTVTVDGEDERVCNRCLHPVLSHSIVRRGCFHCACNYALDADTGTMKTVGAASPHLSTGEGEPASTGPEPGQGDPPPPGIANDDTTANPERVAVGSAPGQPEVQPAATSHPAGPSADPGPLPSKATEGQFRAIHAAMRDNQLGDDARHTIIAFVTGSRTNSSREVTGAEATVILNLLGNVRQGRLSVQEHDGEWKILVMDANGKRFLESIERSIAPTHGRHGQPPVEGSQVAPISADEQGAVI